MFFDTLTTPTIRKKIKRLSSQGEKESRWIWRHVTQALADKDVESATDAKHTVSGMDHFNLCIIFLSCFKYPF